MQQIRCNREEIKCFGITVRTSNQDEFNPQTAKIPSCIMRYVHERLGDRIPNRKNPGITLCAYTDYETDHQGLYTYFIGEEVDSVDTVPEGLEVLTIPSQVYVKFTTPSGPMPSVVITAWMQIWTLSPEDLGSARRYHTDFEVYDERAADPQNTVADVYIGIH